MSSILVNVQEGPFSPKMFHGCWVKRDWEIPLEVKTVAPPIDIMLQEVLLLALILLREASVSHINQESHRLPQETICIILNIHHFYLLSLWAPLQPLVPCNSWSEDLWQSGDVKHAWDSTRLQFCTWGQRRKEVPSEAEELLYNWRKVGSRESNFFQASLLQERFFFRTSYKPFHQLENPLSLQIFSGYVLERSATPPQNHHEAFKCISQILSFCLRYWPSLSFFLLFTPLLPARTATCMK